MENNPYTIWDTFQNLVKFKDSVKKWGLIPTEDEPEVARLAEAMFRVRLEVWLTRRLAASAASEVLLAAWRPTVASAVAY